MQTHPKNKPNQKTARQGDICNVRVFIPIFYWNNHYLSLRENKWEVEKKSIQWDTKICEPI